MLTHEDTVLEPYLPLFAHDRLRRNRIVRVRQPKVGNPPDLAVYCRDGERHVFSPITAVGEHGYPDIRRIADPLLAGPRSPPPQFTARPVRRY